MIQINQRIWNRNQIESKYQNISYFKYLVANATLLGFLFDMTLNEYMKQGIYTLFLFDITWWYEYMTQGIYIIFASLMRATGDLKWAWNLGAAVLCLWLRFTSVEGLHHSPPMTMDSADNSQPPMGEIWMDNPHYFQIT